MWFLFLRRLLISLCLCLTQFASAQSIENPELRQAVGEFISDVDTNDPHAIAQHISFPLTRQNPIPPIKTAKEFVQRFDEVFDEDFSERIIESTLEQDWAQVGSRGVMFNNGELWLGYTGKVIAIHHQTQKDKARYKQIIAKQKRTLHPSLRNFAEPVWTWQNKRYRIRIDKMSDATYRYASWKAGASQSSKPDIIIKNGKVDVQGTSRNTEWVFQNGNYRYVFEHNYIYSRTGYETALWVYHKDKVILKDTDAFERVYE